MLLDLTIYKYIMTLGMISFNKQYVKILRSLKS
jgi:hypothetical protein